MQNPLFDLLPADPETLKVIIGGLVTLLVAGGGLVWKACQAHYQSQIATLEQRLAYAKEQNAVLDANLKDAQPGARLAYQRDLKQLYEEQTEHYVQKIANLESEKEAIAADRESALASAAQLGERTAALTAYLARLDQEKAIVEARMQEVQGFVTDARELTKGLEAAALRSVAKARQEYESKKDTIWHLFVKYGDAREEFIRIRSQAERDADKALTENIKAVEFQEGRDGGHTIVRVVGHRWYEIMHGLEGWHYGRKGPEDYVSMEIEKWATAFARDLQNPKGQRYRTSQMSVWWDCVGLSFVDGDQKTHWISVLATLLDGRLTPMAKYFEGPQLEVEHAARRWESEHRAASE